MTLQLLHSTQHQVVLATQVQSAFSSSHALSATRSYTSYSCRICIALADWDLALGVNVKGYAFGIKHASLAMIKHRQACSKDASNAAVMEMSDLGHSIVNVSSISAFMAQPGFVPYSSTKAAVNEMTRCCALDLGKHSIR